MGRSWIQITADVYGHLVPGGNRDAVDRLNEPRVAKSLQTPEKPFLKRSA
jgi:hypothetical protein